MESNTLHNRLSVAFQVVLCVGVVGAVWERQWLAMLLTIGIIFLTLLPILIERRFNVFIPPELELLAIAFIFASIFLGEVRGYYARFWWWDIALHTSSGFLLGIIGFLLVHVLNEEDEIDVSMKPEFVAFFAFLFAIGVGALWEIFEYAMDQSFGMDMQKEMFGDQSGLTDTMWDLIVDTVGAAIIMVLGYGYLKKAKDESFLERWISKFVTMNPQLFTRSKKQPPAD